MSGTLWYGLTVFENKAQYISKKYVANLDDVAVRKARNQQEHDKMCCLGSSYYPSYAAQCSRCIRVNKRPSQRREFPACAMGKSRLLK